jgi:hypothetical protein
MRASDYYGTLREIRLNVRDGGFPADGRVQMKIERTTSWPRSGSLSLALQVRAILLIFRADFFENVAAVGDQLHW